MRKYELSKTDNGKVRVNWLLCLTKHHAMKTYEGIEA